MYKIVHLFFSVLCYYSICHFLNAALYFQIKLYIPFLRGFCHFCSKKNAYLGQNIVFTTLDNTLHRFCCTIIFGHSTLLLFVFLIPGKWWVVGSAWAGRNPNDKKDNRTENEDDGLAQGGGDIANVSSALLEKAKKLRMNTDMRKNIFCIIMTCEVSFLLNSFLRFFFFEYA